MHLTAACAIVDSAEALSEALRKMSREFSPLQKLLESCESGSHFSSIPAILLFAEL